MKSIFEEEVEKISISDIRDSFNLVLMGDSSVGKTSILERYCNNFFKTEKYYRKTIEIYKKFISFSDYSYQVKFWDAPNFMDNCNNSEINMFHNCDGIIYVCSYDNKDSLTHINTWYQFLTQYIDLSTKEMILIINKKDLKEGKVITEEQIDKKSKDLQLEYYEISAKTGENVNKSIKSIIKKLIERCNERSRGSINNSSNEKEKGGCIII
jgi:small GTP-binding protein